MGTVKHIINNNQQTAPTLPVANMVMFDRYSGPTFLDSGLTPIVPVISRTDDHLERVQIYPLA